MMRMKKLWNMPTHQVGEHENEKENSIFRVYISISEMEKWKYLIHSFETTKKPLRFQKCCSPLEKNMRWHLLHIYFAH